MKKGEIREGIIERIDYPNRGVLRIDGEKVIVKNALPGQRIRLAIHKKRAGRAEGRLLEVLEPSALEKRENVCPHFGVCGGCLYQSLPYEEQLKLKKEQVDSLIREVCGDWGLEGIKGSPIAEGYRNKMEFSFGDEYKDGPLALGMHRRGSFYDVVTTNQCMIVHEDFNLILDAVLKVANEFGLTYYHKITHSGYLRHLLVRRAVKTGEILVHLVTTSHYGEGRKNIKDLQEAERVLDSSSEELMFFDALKDTLKTLPLKGNIKGILHIVNDRVADAILADSVEILDGEDFFFEELLGLKFKISTFSFFQTNSLGAEVLYEKVREYIGETKDKVVFDLYSGTGTIAQLLAPVAKKVIGVEIVADAIDAAQDNAALNGLSNCEFIAGDVLKVLDTIEEKPDYIVLDPPRDGVHPKALEQIIAYGVGRMVYISCKPTSLARDLEVLVRAGYRVERVCMVDMFPGTVNVETIVELQRQDM